MAHMPRLGAGFPGGRPEGRMSGRSF
jgi:hypothetical protein